MKIQIYGSAFLQAIEYPCCGRYRAMSEWKGKEKDDADKRADI